MHTVTMQKARPQLIRPVDHLFGSPSDIIVVEYGDFECPACARAYPEVKRLQKEFEGNIGFVFRHFPHPDIHPHSMMAAEAAEAADAQGKFWAMHDVLFQNVQRLNNADLRRYAESIGLNMSRYDAEMCDHIYLQRVQEHLVSGRASRVKATPVFFVNDKKINIQSGFANVFHVVEAEIMIRKQPRINTNSMGN